MVRMTASYEIRPLAADVLRQLRERDDAGQPPVPVIDDEGGNPLRCCFTRTKPHEEVMLVSYAPLRRWASRREVDPGPYNEMGPIFIHAQDCGGPVGNGFPDDLLGARRVLRAYDNDGRIRCGRYLEIGDDIDGAALVQQELADLYRDPDIVAVHLRAVEHGCFLLETSR
jgi:hypothetical protein